jgi:hypothetical protein
MLSGGMFFMKKGIVVILMAAILTGTAFAQALPAPWAQSAQSTATQGRFRSTMDNFIRPDSFSGVEFDKFFAMAGFQSAQNIQLGYATKLGSTYLGLAYAGNFWSNVTDRTYTINHVEAATSGIGVDKYFKSYTAAVLSGTAPQNLIGVLIGLDSMGFRFAINVDYETFSDEDIVIGTTYYRSYEASQGNITPQLAWSMTKNLTDNGIKPWATMGFGFTRDNAQGDRYVNGTLVTRSMNYFQFTLDLGLGGYTLKTWDGGFRLSADFDYQLIVRTYNNDSPNGSVSGTYDGTNLYDDMSYVQNLLTPSLSGQWSGGDLAFRFKFNLPFTFRSEARTPLATATLLKNGRSIETFTFIFNPNLRLAMQWKAHSKFTVNAGASINLGSITTSTTEGTTYGGGAPTVPNPQPENGSTTFGNSDNSLTLGISFFISDNMTIEATSGVGTNNRLSAFDGAAGVFVFSNIGVSLKF